MQRKNSSQTSGSSSPGSVPLFLRPRALRPPAAADYLGTTPGNIEQLMRDGVLPFRVLGQVRVIAIEDLDAYLDSLPKQTGKLREPVKATEARRVAA
jgi:excisionase family DNA binding protein